MKTTSCVVLIAALLAAPALADEQLEITPIVPSADTVVGYRWNGLELNGGYDPRDPEPRISARWIAMRSDGQCARDAEERCRSIAMVVRGTAARTLQGQLNTANLSTKSLAKRLLEYAQAQGILPAGAIVGTPGLPTETPTPTATPTRTATLTPTEAPTPGS